MGCGLGCESAEVLGKDKCQGSGRAGATQSFLCRENIQPLRLNFFLEGFRSSLFGIFYMTGIITF